MRIYLEWLTQNCVMKGLNGRRKKYIAYLCTDIA